MPDSSQLPYFEQSFEPTVADLQASTQGLQALNAPELPPSTRLVFTAVLFAVAIVASVAGSSVGHPGGIVLVFFVISAGFVGYSAWATKRVLRAIVEEHESWKYELGEGYVRFDTAEVQQQIAFADLRYVAWTPHVVALRSKRGARFSLLRRVLPEDVEQRIQESCQGVDGSAKKVPARAKAGATATNVQGVALRALLLWVFLILLFVVIWQITGA